MKYILPILILCGFLTSCDQPIFTPKPRGYPKVEYPEKAYQTFDASYCDFTFEYPKYAEIQQDGDFFDEQPKNPCWFNIYMPDFDSHIYCTYVPIDEENNFEKLREDAFKMTDWHLKKATYKEEIPFMKPNGTNGILFQVEGPVASHLQFYVTDSLAEKHFLRGALYFNTQARPDSLAPIYKFVKKDLEKLLETFEWGE